MGGLDVLIIYSVCVVPLTVFSVGLFFLSLSISFFFFCGSPIRFTKRCFLSFFQQSFIVLLLWLPLRLQRRYAELYLFFFIVIIIIFHFQK